MCGSEAVFETVLSRADGGVAVPPIAADLYSCTAVVAVVGYLVVVVCAAVVCLPNFQDKACGFTIDGLAILAAIDDTNTEITM